MAREDFRLVYPVRVRWAEVDPQGIVFNPHYLMYCDVGVTEYWRALGFVYPEGLSAYGVDTFAVKATLAFHASARYDELIDVCMRTTRIGRTSLRMAVEIHRGDAHLCSCELIYVVADLKTRKPTPVPDPVRAAIIGYERIAPEA